MNILIVEDDQFLAGKIIQQFEKNAPVNILRHISSYEEFLRESEYSLYDIILLDICLGAELNTQNGLVILEHIRKKNIKIPIVIMSNIVGYSYLEKAFQLGAQDYLIKPFRIRELEIRIQRWFYSYIFHEFFSHPQILKYHDLEFLPSSNEFCVKGKKIEISKSNKYILSLLLINRGVLLSQKYLSEKIWGYSEGIEQKNLRIKILRLKQKLEPYQLNTRIKTIHGEGYILEKK